MTDENKPIKRKCNILLWNCIDTYNEHIGFLLGVVFGMLLMILLLPQDSCFFEPIVDPTSGHMIVLNEPMDYAVQVAYNGNLYDRACAASAFKFFVYQMEYYMNDVCLLT